MINCLRPSNKSSRVTLPWGPSNSYFFSTAIHGIRRRSAASASRERVRVFSFMRSCCCAASHSCRDTTAGVFIAICPFCCSLFLSLLVAMSFLLCFLEQSETPRSEKLSELCRCPPTQNPRDGWVRLGRRLPPCFRCRFGTYVRNQLRIRVVFMPFC